MSEKNNLHGPLDFRPYQEGVEHGPYQPLAERTGSDLVVFEEVDAKFQLVEHARAISSAYENGFINKAALSGLDYILDQAKS